MPMDHSQSDKNRLIVLQYKDGHTFVYDPSIQTHKRPHYFFDVQTERMRGFDPKYVLSFPLLPDDEALRAIKLYRDWQAKQANPPSGHTGGNSNLKTHPPNQIGSRTPLKTNKKHPVVFQQSNPKVSSISSPSEAAQRIGQLTQTNLPEPIAEKQNNKEKIKAICQNLKIPYLVHFTHVKNLQPILEHGIRSRNWVEANSTPGQFVTNDEQRLDGYPNAVSLSISFPNYAMFYKYSRKNRSKWVVLLISTEVLWELDCAFCRENAASSSMKEFTLDSLRSPQAFEQMFANWVEKSRTDLQIPLHFPTHPQAEVLVFEDIQSKYILEVNFYSPEALNKWNNKNIRDNLPRLKVGKIFFKQRCDYLHWAGTSPPPPPNFPPY